ncbi:MAG: endonuclease MutS2, partial [Bacteroidota bacterium]
MKYPSDFERIVGFDGIRSSIAQRCKYPSTQNLIATWEMQTTHVAVMLQLDLLDQVHQLNELSPSVLQFQGEDIHVYLPHLGIENFYLEEEALAAILATTQTYQKLAATVQLRADFWALLSAELPNEDYTKKIAAIVGRVIDEFNQISVRATPQYAKLSQEIQRLEGEARNVMRGIFRDWKSQGFTAETDVTVREERLVIPVLAEFKRRVQGFVKDISATGKVLYVEPTQMLEMNNRLKELFAERRRERERILRLVTAELSPYQVDLQVMMDRLVHMDFALAKFDWCAREGAERPKVSERSQITLRRGIHPVLRKELKTQKKEAIPLSLELNEQRVMVVSGPNAGGKSVVLKTVLLLQYMVQCGLFVTADPESRFGIFDYLGIDCGDGQDIQQGLSTFSAHLQHLKNLLEHASDRSLIGMDEIGAGTDPRFGAPIAQAVLEQLLSKGSFVIATTHFSQLREWGMGYGEVVQASMAYDAHALKPLYHLVVGKPGSSFALELMRKTGFDTQWIDRIKTLAGKQMGKTEDLMLSLERQNQQLLQQVKTYEDKLKHLEELTASYQSLKDKLQSKRQEYLAAARDEAKKLLADTNQQIENTIRAIREHGAEKEATLKARNKLGAYKTAVETGAVVGGGKPEGLRGSVDFESGSAKTGKNTRKKGAESLKEAPGKAHLADALPITSIKQLVPGVLVKSLATEAQGEVLDVKKDKVWVAFGVVKMWVPVTELMLSKTKVGGKSMKTGATGGYQWVERQSNYKTSLDVRGQRMDDATQKVLLWLEEGYSLGHAQLKIVHGRGDGILRKGLKSLLKTVNFVRSYHHETEAEGGDGALIVQL